MSSTFAIASFRIRCLHLATLGLAAVGLALCAASEVRGDTLLRWKFRLGDDSKYTLSTTTEQEMTVNEQKLKMTIQQVFDQTWKTGEVKPDGTATVNQTNERIQMLMSTAQGDQKQSSKYDSADENKGGDMFAATMAKLLGPMIGKAITLAITPRGDISNYKAPEDMFSGIKGAPGMDQMGGMFSEAGMKQITDQTMLKFPVDKVVKGTTWKTSFETPNPLGKQKVDATYTYAGTERVDGKELDKIDLHINTSIELPPDAPNKITIKDQKSSGAMYFDNAAGRLEKSDSTMSMKIEVAAEAMKVEIESTVKTLYQRHDAKK